MTMGVSRGLDDQPWTHFSAKAGAETGSSSVTASSVTRTGSFCSFFPGQ